MRRNYQDPAYAEWRKRVYKRDRWRCQMPECSSKKRLQAHHIQRWADASALRYDLDNGITLCKQCHDSINGKEIHYTRLFMSIVSSNNG
jgi:5-methylcytosine-specific restriction endonuclease McrA